MPPDLAADNLVRSTMLDAAEHLIRESAKHGDGESAAALRVLADYVRVHSLAATKLYREQAEARDDILRSRR